ncbi:hypothetical protein H9657_02000 [Cellulomonas sp. Sa3CUA2]|uniref:Carrier domain-containing protein n=1 Tax=Cellulomonas avistercoris TaxID=2762242 RepID=A0ABR8Q9H7_9CELL|nr:phosphopantetheine-binding protein [Cellulomonas avistercoris]MBD7917055.1 hypothetical protein [Cellulomonas avistercoris]
MNADDFYAAMTDFLGERLRADADDVPAAITAQQDLVEAGLLDSLRVIQMIARAEELTGGTVDLAETDLESLYSLEGLYAAVR